VYCRPVRFYECLLEVPVAWRPLAQPCRHLVLMESKARRTRLHTVCRVKASDEAVSESRRSWTAIACRTCMRQTTGLALCTLWYYNDCTDIQRVASVSPHTSAGSSSRRRATGCAATLAVDLRTFVHCCDMLW